MPITITPEWQHIVLYALAAALGLMLLQSIPVVGRIVRSLVSLGFLAFVFFLLIQQAPYHPKLAQWSERIGIGRQEVSGREVRIPMSPDGHFWARATINGVERRMLIDSGATVTALSTATARAAGIAEDATVLPVMLRTANGVTQAQTGAVDELRLGPMTARDVKVVIAPAFGDFDVIGMNFLSRLHSWRVEGDVLILVPEAEAAEA